MPFRSEHSARIKRPDPRRYKRYRSKSFGGGIRATLGVLRDPQPSSPATEVQALHFSSFFWTVKEAKAWLRTHRYRILKFEAAKANRKH